MPDLSLSVTVSRTLLSLSPLELNDHTNFYIAAASVLGASSWERQQASSPFTDDDYTVSRRRTKIMEQITVEVRADTLANMATNLAALRAAVSQDSFTITTAFSGMTLVWACEAGDFQGVWSGPRMIARQMQVVLQIPRSPNPVSGAF